MLITGFVSVHTSKCVNKNYIKKKWHLKTIIFPTNLSLKYPQNTFELYKIFFYLFCLKI